jgi:hypothetical protein
LDHRHVDEALIAVTMQADPAVGFCEVSLWLNKRKTWLRIFKPRTTSAAFQKKGLLTIETASARPETSTTLRTTNSGARS